MTTSQFALASYLGSAALFAAAATTLRWALRPTRRPTSSLRPSRTTLTLLGGVYALAGVELGLSGYGIGLPEPQRPHQLAFAIVVAAILLALAGIASMTYTVMRAVRASARR